MTHRKTLAPRLRSRTLLIALAVALAGSLQTGRPSASASDLYTSEIKPLLAEKCVSCHGPVRQEAGLRLDAARLIRQGGDSGEIVVAHEADDSELLWRVTADDDSRMPPEGEGPPLNPQQLERLTRWIVEGLQAPDDEVVLDGPRDHWSFQPIRRPDLPLHSDALHPIDALLDAQRSDQGLLPAPIADRETILRRLTFGLLGLPPTADQRDRFLNIASEAGERRFVENLLADPAHAERWARHWMDVWRYSDWDGYKNELRGSQRHIWRWRDWIVESLSADRSYAQMIRQMLAGDEIAPLDDEILRATGFLARNFHKSNRNIWLDATVEHTAKAFVGLTLDCARCHDHKYDPLSQQEYYQFRAIFEPHHVRTDRVAGVLDTMQDGLPRAFDAELNADTQFLIGGNEKQPDESRQIVPGVPQVLGVPLNIEPRSLPPLAVHPALHPDRAREELEAAERAVKAAEAAWSKAAADAADVAAEKVHVAKAEFASLQARLQADRAKYLAPPELSDPGQASEWSPSNVDALAAEASARERELVAAKATLSVVESRQTVVIAERKQAESQDDSESDELKKARESLAAAEQQRNKAIEALGSESHDYTAVGPAYPEQSSGRRTALADWIIHPDNPLTARVAVNHVWLRHFGQPLVENTFDFGLRSPRPVQVAVLDWLASELIDSGWSLKHLHRLIVSSRTYRQASQLPLAADRHNRAIDPDNHYYWHFNVIRLEAEVIRDALMAAAGALDHRLGGPEIDYARGEEVLRRSLYIRHAYEKQMTMLTTFDAASPNECYRRSPSIIPQQALVLANSPLSRKMASQLAESIRAGIPNAETTNAEAPNAESPNAESPNAETTDLHQADDSIAADQRHKFVEQAFLRVLGRVPDEAELGACVAFLRSGQADTNLVHVLMNHNDFVVVR